MKRIQSGIQCFRPSFVRIFDRRISSNSKALKGLTVGKAFDEHFIGNVIRQSLDELTHGSHFEQIKREMKI